MNSQAPGRALIVVRLSRVTDATTSPERQLANVPGSVRTTRLRGGRGGRRPGHIGRFYIAVRPPSARGLAEEPLGGVRRSGVLPRRPDCPSAVRPSGPNPLVPRALGHVGVATETHFDLVETDFGDIIALLVAKVAEMELAAISERNASAAKTTSAPASIAAVFPVGLPPRPEERTGDSSRTPSRSRSSTRVVSAGADR